MSKYKVGDKVVYEDAFTGKSGVGKVDSMQIYYSVITDNGKCVAAHEDDLSPYVEPLKVGDSVYMTTPGTPTHSWRIVAIMDGGTAILWDQWLRKCRDADLAELMRA